MTKIDVRQAEIDWSSIYANMESPQGRALEQRLRKLESKVPRNTVSISEIDPLKDLQTVKTKRSR